MMSLVEFFSQPVWHRLGLTLVHFLWQGLAAAVIVCAAVRVLGLKRGNPRYAAYLLAFAAMTVSPLLTFIILGVPAQPVPVPPASIAPGRLPEMESPEPVAPSLSPQPASPRHENVSTVGPTHLVRLRQRFDRVLQPSLPWALAGWMGGVLVLSVRLLLGFLGVHRWRRHAEPLPEGLEARVARLSERLGLPGFRRVFTSRQAREVVALGYLRPMVLLPVTLMTQMPPEMLEAVIAHELAHIRRLDLWVNLAQRVVETLLFYHPAVWWLSSRLRSERELCCDELAVQATGERLTYASALERASQARFASRQPILAMGLGQGKRTTLGRIRHVLGLPPSPPDSRFWLAGVISVALLALPAVSVLTAEAAVQAPTDDAGAAPIFGNPTNLGASINSSNEEYDPTISADELELYFTSLRVGGQADLWVTTRKTKADPWGEAMNLGPMVNGPAGDKTPCISADGLSLYFSSDRPGGSGAHDLWVTTRKTKSDLWGAPVNLGPTVNSPADELAPSVSTNGLELYFSGHAASPESVRPGGSGEADLWVTTRKTTRDPWGKPVNLGPTVNSPSPDASPSISGDGLSLYFNSDRPGGSGGGTARAIWVTRRKSTGDPWGKPVKLGLAINTSVEVNPEISKDGSALYFSSRRPGGLGGADLWQATLAKSTPESRTQAQLAASLHEAVKGRDIEQVKLLLAKGANVNVKDGIGCTPLYFALQNRDPEMVKVLVAKGADVNLTPEGLNPPLHLAVWYGNLDVVRLLVDHGAKLDAKGPGGRTAFRNAAAARKRDLVEFFVSKGIDLPALHLAACVGNLARVKALVEQGTNVDGKDELGWTPLYWATCLGRSEVAQFLVANGASVNVVMNDAGTPLMQAAVAGDRELVDLMLSKGADVKAKTQWGGTALYYAVAGGHREIAESLIAKGADVNAKTQGGETALYYAVAYGHREIAESLIAKGADVNAKTNRGQTLLDLALNQNRTAMAEILAAKGAEVSTLPVAVRMGDLARVKALLEKGADINAKDSAGMTALQYAARDGRKEIVEVLLAKGANVNAGATGNNQTAADFAMNIDHIEIVELLIAKGADISALHVALLRKDRAKAKDLIENGADVNKQTPYGTSPLDMAVRAGFKDIAEMLIAKGANVDKQTPHGISPLDMAVRKGFKDIAEMLIAKGANVNAGDGWHWTALCSAACGGPRARDMVEMLVAHGANVNATDGGGATAAEWALLCEQTDIVELLISKGATGIPPLFLAVQRRDLTQLRDLLEKGADVNRRTQCGTSPLHVAAKAGLTEIAAVLLDKGANVKATENEHRTTPLHDAARNGHKDVVELLIAKGAEVNASDREGRTPLGFAREKAHTSVVELLQKHGAKE